MVRKYRGSEVFMAIIIVLLLCLMALIARSAINNAHDCDALEAELATAYQDNVNLSQTNETLFRKNTDLLQEISVLSNSNNVLRGVLLEDGGAFSKEELLLAIRVAIAECGNQPIAGQMAVAQVMRDRLYEGSFGSTLTEVLTKEGQFAKPYGGDIYDYQDAVLSVLRVLVLDERVFDEPVYYFYNAEHANPKAVTWFETLPLMGEIGDHTFRGK